jgi:hypothetical protein
MAEKVPVGVLFVHGIGNEAQGQTLVEYAGSLYKWIEDWLNTAPTESTPSSGASEKKGDIKIEKVDLHPSDDAPAHTEWHLQVRQDNGEFRKSKWLLAESWWAETFAPAGWRQTILWAIQVAPLMILLHFTTLSRNVILGGSRNFLAYLLSWLVVPVYVLVGVVFALVVEVLAVVLVVLTLVLAIVPISTLSTYITKLQFIVSNWAGDIYLRITSPLQRAAMVSKVKRDLMWLTKRCEKVAVVSHSQGAAITFEILEQNRPDNVKQFVTLGSAIKLLKVVESTSSTGIYYTVMIILDILLPYLAIQTWRSAGVWWQAILNGDLNSFLILVSIFLWISVLSIILEMLGRKLSELVTSNPLEGSNILRSDTSFKWVDLYASHDPAPNGTLGKNVERFESQEVYNHANPVTDHTTYWGNRDGFLPSVFRAITELDETEFPGLSQELINEAKDHRKWRVICLSGARSLMIACSIALLLIAAANDHISRLGAQFIELVLQALGSLPSVDANSSIAGDWTPSAFTKGAIGGILFLTAPVAWYLVMKLVWQGWGDSDLKKLLRVETRQADTNDFGGFWFFLFLVFPILLVIATGIYSASQNEGFLEELKILWSIRQPIGWITVIVFFSSLILVAFSKTYTKEKAFSPAIRITLLATPILTWIVVNIVYSYLLLFVVGVLSVGLVLLYDRFIGSQLKVGSHIGKWLTQLKSSAVVDIPRSDTNLNRLSAAVVQAKNLVPTSIVVIMGAAGLWLTANFLKGWGEADETISNRIFTAIMICVGVGLYLSGFANKESTPKWMRSLIVLGILMLIMSCLLLTLKACLPS